MQYTTTTTTTTYYTAKLLEEAKLAYDLKRRELFRIKKSKAPD